MERSVAVVRVKEAIPTPVRVAGWPLILVPMLAFLAERPGQGRQMRSLVVQSLAVLGLGEGIAPLEFLALTWVVVALVFWGQAHAHGHRLGRKSSLVVVAALVSQAMLFALTSAA